MRLINKNERHSNIARRWSTSVQDHFEPSVISKIIPVLYFEGEGVGRLASNDGLELVYLEPSVGVYETGCFLDPQ